MRQRLEDLVVPEGGAAKSKYKDLECQPALIDPKETNGALTEVSTQQGDLPPENATAANTPVPAGAATGAMNAPAGKPKPPTHKRLESACQASSTDEEAA